MTTALPALDLLPYPRKVTFEAGAYRLPTHRLIAITNRELWFIAEQIQGALRRLGLHWEIVVWSESLPTDQIGLTLETLTTEREQHYMLDISAEGVAIGAAEPAGFWYGTCTLIQILQQRGQTLPCLKIDDYPDFPRRGVMLDISRDKVPTMETLYALVDKLASWKINEFQLYTEHTFAYRKHQRVWQDASPMTGEQILALDAYCRARYIDLVPNQNSFGHFHRWLMHDEYRPLAENPDGVDYQFMLTTPRPFGLAPQVPGGLQLIRSLFDELLPHFSSRFFNIGCDETFDLGTGRSKEQLEELGGPRLYLEFLKEVATAAHSHGRIAQFWGDIVMEHPELVPELPKDLIALEWGYEANHPFAEHGAKFAASGIRFYVCPGTSSWLTLIGRTENAMGNLLNAAVNGKRNGAIGYLITDWGDFGHHQTLPVSYLGFAYGAAVSWAEATNRDLDLPAALSRFAFEDPTGVMGQLAYDFGNVYRQATDFLNQNSATVVRALYESIEGIRTRPLNSEDKVATITPAIMRNMIADLDRLIARLDDARPADPLVVQEYKLGAQLFQHACQRLLMAHGDTGNDTTLTAAAMSQSLRGLLNQYSTVWLARNRPGGLSDSMTRFTRLIAEYEQETQQS